MDRAILSGSAGDTSVHRMGVMRLVDLKVAPTWYFVYFVTQLFILALKQVCDTIFLDKLQLHGLDLVWQLLYSNK